MRIIFLIGLCVGGCAASDLDGAVYDLETKRSDGKIARCTAFAVDDNHVMTAGHCVWMCDYEDCQYRLTDAQTGEHRGVTWVDSANAIDYAIIETERSMADSFVLAHRPPRKGETVCMTTARPDNGVAVRCGKVEVVDILTIVRMSAYPGDSGSPVYDSSGLLLGILVNRIGSDRSGFVAVRRIHYL